MKNIVSLVFLIAVNVIAHSQETQIDLKEIKIRKQKHLSL